MTELSRKVMLERSEARDSTFDGRFLTGVVTTGIYCLPSCGARKPLPRNVRFFGDEESAQEAGLRACRRCRPDRFYTEHDPGTARAVALVEALRHDPAQFRSVEDLARFGGLGIRAFRDLVRRQYQLTPSALLQREQVAAAARSLARSRTPLLDVAAESGFESASAFHENFRQSAGMTPLQYRKLGGSRTFSVALPDGFRSEDPLRMFGRNPSSMIESVSGRSLRKALVIDGYPVVIALQFSRGRASCALEAAGKVPPGVMYQAHAIVLRLLGLTIDPGPMERQLKGPDRRLVAGHEGLRIPQTADVFEGLLWSIVGQQVMVSFAQTLRNTIVMLCGRKTADGMPAHPTASDVARLDLADLTRRQFSRSKAEYLLGAARAAASGNLPLEDLPYGPFPTAARSLLALHGIGVWSANYILMRSCGFADCVPAGDTGLSSALQDFDALAERPDIRQTEILMERFAPYRSLATMHFWMWKSEMRGKR